MSNQHLRPTETMGNVTRTMPGGRETLTLQDLPYSPVISATRINEYEIIDVISENTGEGSIYKGTKDNTEFAIKLYHKNKRPKKEIIEQVKSVDSPYVIPVLDEGMFEEKYYEVLPFYSKKDLQGGGKVSEEHLVNTIIPNVNKGLKALHDKGIVHRDIKPNNIFYSNDGQSVVIGDFGISSSLGAGMSVRMTSASRTLGYSAPETANGVISKEVDYYSFGVTLLHLVLGMDPFEGMTDQQILVQTLNYPLPMPESMNPKLSMLVTGLTLKDRQHRWGYEEVDRWLNNEHVPVNAGNSRPTRSVSPYRIKGEEIYDLKSLALALAQNWNEGIRHLNNGNFIENYLENFGQDLAVKAVDFKKEYDKDFALFKIIYLLNEAAPLCWRGQIYMDLNKLCEKILESLPNINDDISKMFSSKAFVYYLKNKGFNEDLINEFARIREISNSEELYYRAFFILQGAQEEEHIPFKFMDETLYTPEDIAYLLYKEQDRLEEVSERLLASKYFFLWLEYNGYKEHIESWRQIYQIPGLSSYEENTLPKKGHIKSFHL
ncbi:serine/threonine protein kinase [Evansella sp. LMS18]|uniref:serine/threonine-protein kinase n=1 Tax=Evansella sp. LMS18 TaxID=2924033 RepID=UPI0020D15585|nr:serine/threonine-protein kinase [Evansella sp. LMS18]UTR12093.1 serine/threonine protein kinase [Evansella sp. LMS18]